jgi:peptide-methionine (S)-S-oxide reductase
MQLKSLPLTLALAAGFLLTSCFADEGEVKTSKSVKVSAPVMKEGMEIATMGAGCFWCIEAVLEQLDGVEAVVAGYMGGKTKDPTYKDICRGDTGHAEVVQVLFDPKKVSYDKVLSYFWRMHDPTTLNRQGNDVGTQYRSVVFYHSDEQREKAEAQKKKVDEAKVFENPLVTEISKVETFYPAEEYHQDYYRLNKDNPDGNIGYCRYMIAPKLDKLGLSK